MGLAKRDELLIAYRLMEAGTGKMVRKVRKEKKYPKSKKQGAVDQENKVASTDKLGGEK